MLKQYHSIKAKHPNCILFFRLGDFYEMFFDDAKIVSHELNIVLTARGKGTLNKVPMCGFPHHSADNYIARLVKAGHKIAICEQLEDPSVAKGIVKRDIIRVITSGTYLDETTSDIRYLFCINPTKLSTGIAFIDPSTGSIQTNEVINNQNKIIELIAKLPVYECIYPESATATIESLFNNPLLKLKNIVLSPYHDWCFNPDISRKSICHHFGIHNLNSFGIEDLPLASSCSSALLEYLKEMNKQPLKHIDRVSIYSDDDFVFVSPAAHRGLELDTLIKTIDYTLTPLGKRKFKFWVYHPLKNKKEILHRQDAINLLKNNVAIFKELKPRLNKIPDIEKHISRLSCGYTHAKDLLAIRNVLSDLPDIKNILKPLQSQNSIFEIDDIASLSEHLLSAIDENVPLSKPEGKIIKTGYNKELDSLRDIQENGRKWLSDLQQKEIKRTKINSLKIGYNKVFGYYIEITKSHLKSVPDDFIRKQTLVNAERFITPKLKEFEEKILTAQDKIVKIENEIVKELQKEILNNSLHLHQLCESIANLDAIYSLCVLAQSSDYTCPLIEDSALLDIKDGRHPVVEKTTIDSFVPNDTLLDSCENHLIILTGPNMSGKSTYIRQTAILVILAQVGSYIPAKSATVGIVDKVFTRIGAHDDISRGQSTFMVEMNETADILNNMTDRSLIILDEIGRGTSTYDGLSLAWALAEHLKNQKARTLFATHFHELTALSDKNSGVKNYNVAVKEWKDEIIFLHKIIPGSTDDSYGIYVAKLAGIPKNIISRAKKLLTKIELKSNLKEHLSGKLKSPGQLTFFETTNIENDPDLEEIRKELGSIDINKLTPIEAINILQDLIKKCKETE